MVAAMSWPRRSLASTFFAAVLPLSLPASLRVLPLPFWGLSVAFRVHLGGVGIARNTSWLRLRMVDWG